MCTMGLRARRKAGNALDSTGSETHRTSCFRMIYSLSANNGLRLWVKRQLGQLTR